MRSVALGFCVRILMYVAQHDQWVLRTVQHDHQGAACRGQQTVKGLCKHLVVAFFQIILVSGLGHSVLKTMALHAQ